MTDTADIQTAATTAVDGASLKYKARFCVHFEDIPRVRCEYTTVHKPKSNLLEGFTDANEESQKRCGDNCRRRSP